MQENIACRFWGGPNGEEILRLPAMACRDTVGIASDVWMAKGPDGTPQVMKGPRTPLTAWISFSRDVYQKVIPAEPGSVTYQFVRSEQVNRCAKLLPDKGRRCGNEAEAESEFCRTHKGTR